MRDKNGHLTSQSVWHGSLFETNFGVIIPLKQKWKQNMLKLWHETLGYVNLRAMHKRIACRDIGVRKDSELFWETCVMGKPHSFVKAPNNFRPGKKVHIYRSLALFFIVQKWVPKFEKSLFLRHKSGILEKLKGFYHFVTRQTGNKFSISESDKQREGTRYYSRIFITLCWRT